MVFDSDMHTWDCSRFSCGIIEHCMLIVNWVLFNIDV